MSGLIVPEWPAPRRVRALVTTRRGGVSKPPFDSFNLAIHVGDDPAAVARNRELLGAHVPSEPFWLEQVHGVAVTDAGHDAALPLADAAVSSKPGRICVVMTADCLPVLLCDRGGTVVAAAHAGWRGLAGGVLEATVAAMGARAGDIMAYLGPAIGPTAFEVGDEVREAFVADAPAAQRAFRTGRAGKWFADIYGLAHLRLAQAGVEQVFGGGFCTFTDSERFFSFRRDGVTGRMASLIWLAD